MFYHQEISCDLTSLKLERGGETSALQVTCCLWGDLSKPLVVLMGGISADRFVCDIPGRQQGWWQQVINRDSVINLSDFAFLTFEYISFPERLAKPPVITPGDQANVLYRLQQQLKLPQFHAVIGASYGGMVCLSFANQHPHALKQWICLAAAERNSVKSQALRHIQRSLIKLGEHHGHHQHLQLARSLAMVGYRGEAEFEQRFAAADPGNSLSAVAAYLEHHGRQFVQRFSAHRYLQLSQSIDHHHTAVDDITAPGLLIGFSSDQMVPVSFLEQLQQKVNSLCELHILDSEYGHDGFLLEPLALNQLFQTFLSGNHHDHFERNHRCAGGY
jgi:homoserine O-acetyltransferase